MSHSPITLILIVFGLGLYPQWGYSQQVKGGGSGKERGPELCVKLTDSVNRRLPAFLLPSFTPIKAQSSTEANGSLKGEVQSTELAPSKTAASTAE